MYTVLRTEYVFTAAQNATKILSLIFHSCSLSLDRCLEKPNAFPSADKLEQKQRIKITYLKTAESPIRWLHCSDMSL